MATYLSIERKLLVRLFKGGRAAIAAIISDAANWPPLKGRSLSGYQQKRVWLNDGQGHFNEVAQLVGVTDRYDGRAVALGDFGNRGVLDVVVANQRAPLLFYKNTVSPENHWIEFDLEGVRSNRSAIGAQVRVFWNGQQQVQEVSGGSGFCCPEPATAALRPRPSPRYLACRDSLAIRYQADSELALGGSDSSREGAGSVRVMSLVSRFFSIENRYLPPIFITTILLVGQLSFGLLESLSRTLLAIGTSMLFDLALGAIVYGKIPHLASAYITGISVGILVRSPEHWPYALTSAIAITSKYVIRWHGRHFGTLRTSLSARCSCSRRSSFPR